MKAAVIGSPISHSLSPYIFNFIAHACGHPIDYQSFDVKISESKSFLQSIKKQKDFLGLNITLPLKELFLDEINFLSPEVKALGALNVLHFNGTNICGYNTDIVGIKKTFEGMNFSVQGKTCLLIGAGGSAKAVAYVLGTLKASNVLIFNRSDKSRELVNKFNLLFSDTKWSAISSFSEELITKTKIDLIINSTPLGMTGKESGAEFFKPIKELKFSNDALAFDLIYTPEHTDFLHIAKALGLATVGGLGMLIDQALATWKIWVGDLENELELHQKLKDFLNGILVLRQSKNPVFLTGFMGVGKSSVAAELAAFLGRTFLDTDKLIEANAGLTIPEIFTIKGEATFRDFESRIISELSLSENSIVSLGGGALINDDNREVIVNSGLLVYLAAKETTLLERITKQNNERPLLANLSQTEKNKKISELLNLRKATYEKADIHIQTDNLNPVDTAFEILSAIGKNARKE